jgi:hydrogenase maturation protease
MRTILVGLGNPILGDDASGWRVVEQVEQQLQKKTPAVRQNIDIFRLALGGLGLMERLIGYDRAIIVDAITSGSAAPGTVSQQALGDLPDFSAGHTSSAHDTSLANSVRLARQMGLHLPEEILVVGIETRPTFEFSDELTADIAAVIPKAVQTVLELLA